MPSHAVAVRRVIQSTSTTGPGTGERGTAPPVVSTSVIQLVSGDGTMHVRLYGHAAADYPPGAEYDITITPRTR